MGQTDFDYGHNLPGNYTPDYSYECTGTVKCELCGRRHGICHEINAQLTGITHDPGKPSTAIDYNNPGIMPDEWREKMLPTVSQGSGTSPRRDGLPKLNNTMLSRTPKEFRILAVRAIEGKFGPQVLCKVAHEGQPFLWYLNASPDKNPCYKALLAKFGEDENDWLNQAIWLHLEKDEVTEQSFMRVTFETATAKKK